MTAVDSEGTVDNNRSSETVHQGKDAKSAVEMWTNARVRQAILTL